MLTEDEGRELQITEKWHDISSEYFKVMPARGFLPVENRRLIEEM
ncbi:hypothetical protein [Chlorobaculum sp. 24CR]|nr:hypothetical protein [Chlorobaculum sp. 24CR]